MAATTTPKTRDELIAALSSITSLSEREIRHLLANLHRVGAVIVPLEPTAQMLDALTVEVGGQNTTPDDGEWSAMLAVSPFSTSS